MKILIVFLMFFLSSIFTFADSNPSCVTVVSTACVTDQASWTANCKYYAGYSPVPADIACTEGSPMGCAKKDTCTCPEGQKINTVIDAGVEKTNCVSDEPGEESCPSGQFRDGRGKCNTKCEAPNVHNIMTDACEPVTDCVYPQLYNALANACADNPENCAEGAIRNVLTGQCQAYGDTSCPTGYSCADESCLTCAASGGGASSASGGAASSSPSGSASNGSSGSNTSAAPPKPPVGDSDNGDQGQPVTGSKPIPANTSPGACLTQNSAQVCNDFQNCQLTFGVGNCVGMSPEQTCPNQYVLNGQKYCVVANTGTGSSSGTAGSSGNSGSSGSASSAGECDPTKKSYDECMGRNKTPNATETSKINSDLVNAGNKAIDDYTKLIKEDTEAFTRDGITFKTAPDALKQAVLSHIPQASACQPITFTYFGTSKSLNCELFEKFKLILAWFCSLVTLYYIFHLAVKPVAR
ncbi:MAG: hypothetical protein EOO52_19980 [Gammaproteobacteria bacterium]|nr:MAG: hypothetical protein EOO52_19980 [Gammaproteobacteria bacterium]